MKWWTEKWASLLQQELGERYRRLRYESRKTEVAFFEIGPGYIKAKLRKGKGKFCFVRLEWDPVPAGIWQKAGREMARKALWKVRLPAGDLPESATGLLKRQGAELFPDNLRDMKYYASLDPDVSPGRYGVLVHFRFLEMMEEDPFCLLEFRGADRETLLGMLAEEGPVPVPPGKKSVSASSRRPASAFWFGNPARAGRAFEALKSCQAPAALEEKEDAPFTIRRKNVKEYLRMIYSQTRKSGS